jgi:hypothetical protein
MRVVLPKVGYGNPIAKQPPIIERSNKGRCKEFFQVFLIAR